MVDSAQLRAIFNRLEAGKRLGKQDLQILTAAVRSQQLTIATGDRAVAIGGNADGAVIVTGDRNIIITRADADAIRELLGKRHPNEKLLLKAVQEEVTERLNQSLHNAVLIQLGMESQPHQVMRPWDSDIKIGDKPAQPIPTDWNVLRVFDEVHGKLLILGDPGAGKTTMMLELAEKLLRQAELSADIPIPVIFNLSDWKNEQRSIRDWLIEELRSKYGVRKDFGTELVDEHRLLIMLDGLDELESSKQKPCVQEINRLLQSESRPQYLVVCSRYEEYEKVIRGQWTKDADTLTEETKLVLNGAYRLKSLNNNQIQDYLVRLNRRDLWFALKHNPIVLDLVKTPFWLSILVLSEQSIIYGEWQNLETKEELFVSLLKAYIEQMLSRRISRSSLKRIEYLNRKQTLYWLSYLARRLQENYETEFSIEQMQTSWLKKKQINSIYQPLLHLFLGLNLAIFFALIGYIALGNSLGLWGFFGAIVFGLFIGVASQFRESIETVETLRWSWKEFGYGVKNGLSNGFLLVANVAQWFSSSSRSYYWNFWQKIGYLVEQLIMLLGFFVCLILGLLLGIGGGIFQGLASGLIGASAIENKVLPNEGIWNSLRSFENVLKIWMLGTGMVAMLIASFTVTSLEIFSWGLIGTVFGMFVGIFVGLERGGKTCIQHLILRVLLYLDGDIPWDFANFLDYCTVRLFLQRVGGRYRFMHRLLQEYFAAMQLENE